MKKAILILSIFALLQTSFGETQGDRKKSKGCLYKLAMIVGMGGLVFYGGYEAYHTPPKSSQVEVKYSPKLSKEEKLFEIFMINKIFDPVMTDSVFNGLEPKLKKIGIPAPDFVKDKSLREQLLKWISERDPDPDARALAKRLLDSEKGMTAEERYKFVTQYLGVSIPDYDYMSKNKREILYRAAKKGFTPAQRLGLLAIEEVEGDPFRSLRDRLHVGPEVPNLTPKGYAFFLRTLPGFLEKVDLPKNGDLTKWFDLALEKVDPNDKEFAKQLGKAMGDTWVYNSGAAIFLRLSPNLLSDYLEAGENSWSTVLTALDICKPEDVAKKYLEPIKSCLASPSKDVQRRTLLLLQYRDDLARSLRPELKQIAIGKDPEMAKLASSVSK